jgi:hypothetical protein
MSIRAMMIGGAGATRPDPPTGVSAGSATTTTMSVSFSAPANNGGSAITGFTVTSSPGGLTATGASSPLTVTGLTASTSYTFTVTATNAIGTSDASSPSSAVSTAAALGTLSAVPSGLSGQLVLGNYGVEMWSTGFGFGEFGTGSFVVPTGCTKIRAICIGAGGGANGNEENIRSGQGGAGVEGFITVTPGETLTCEVGKGGKGSSSSPSGNGGNTSLKRGGTVLMYAPGGSRPGSSGSLTGNAGEQYVGTNISIGRGGSSGDYGGPSPAAESVSVALSGAYAHAGGSATIGSPVGTGLGFGGGGGKMGTSNPADRTAGGIYGYAGGVGTSEGGYRGLGPVGGLSNDSGVDSSSAGSSGPGGGSFGGAGGDYYSGGYGAGGLIRIWYASAAGDPNWINTGGNYV